MAGLACLARGYGWTPEVLGGLTVTQVAVWGRQLTRILALESGERDPLSEAPSDAEAATAGVEAAARMLAAKVGRKTLTIEEVMRGKANG